MKKKLKKIEKEIIRNGLITYYCDILEKLTGLKVVLTGTVKWNKKKKI